jgi:hypothetical protein
MILFFSIFVIIIEVIIIIIIIINLYFFGCIFLFWLARQLWYFLCIEVLVMLD